MVTWESFSASESDSAWNNLLLQAIDYTVFQSYGWGEYKRHAGWIPLRYVARNKSGKVLGMVQLLLKPLPLGAAMIWAPGGPVLRFNSSDIEFRWGHLTDLLDDLRNKYPLALIRFHSHLPSESGLAYEFSRVCRRPFFKINSGFSIHMNLLEIGDHFNATMTSKHRYYVKRAESSGIRWSSGTSESDIHALLYVHREMIKNKKMLSIATSEANILNLRNSLGKDGLTILTGFLDDEPVTSCLTLNFGNKSIYMVAATGKKGRENCAAYAMVTRLIPLLQKKGIEYFDFGGLDPISSNAEGVNHFKRGFGGQIVEYLGEWETARNEWVRSGMNLALWKRGGRV